MKIKTKILFFLLFTFLFAKSQNCNLTTFAGNDTLICGISTNINGILTNSNNNCLWHSNNPYITFSNPNNHNTNIFVDTCGTYEIFLTETDSAVCSNTDTVIICFRENEPIEITHETLTDTICNSLSYSTNIPAGPPPNIQCSCENNEFYDNLIYLLDSLYLIPPIISAHWGWTGPQNASVIFEYDSTTYNPFSVTVNDYGNYHFYWVNAVRDSLTNALIDSISNLLCLGGNDIEIYDIDLYFYNFGINSTITDQTCNDNCDGAYQISTIGGIAPYTYLQGSEFESNLCSNQYNIVIEDSFGCIVDQNILIGILGSAPIYATSTNITCFSENNGTAIVNTSSSNNFPILWSNGSNNDTIFSLSPGTYTVTVYDDYGCQSSTDVTITEPPQLFFNETISNETCYNFCDGTANIEITGGTPPYSILWSNGALSQNINNLCGGEYYYTITESNGCNYTDSVKIQSADSIDIESNFTPKTCYGECNGSIEIQSSILSSLNFNWSNNETTSYISSLCSGNYTVTISNNNCNIIKDFEITENDIIEFDTPNQLELCIDGQQNITITPTSGISPFQFLVNNIPSNNTFTVYGNINNYSIQIIDSNNCSSNTQNIVITNPETLSASIISNIDTVCSNTQIIINLETNGGLPPINNYNQNNEPIQFPYSVNIENDTTLTFITTDACNQSITSNIPIYTYDTPLVQLSSDKLSGCSPLKINLNSSSNYGTWNINNTSFTQGNSFSHTFYTPGTYNISQTVISNNNCIYKYFMDSKIEVYSNPIADFDYTANTISENNVETELTNKSIDATSYYWNFSDGTSSTDINPNHNFNKANNYIELIALNEFGCKDTVKKLIETDQEYTIFLPNTFTPNSNGINNIFKPFYTGISTSRFHMYVYDRWGEKIWETENPELGWDGRAKGKQVVQNDVYTWLIYFYDLKGYKHEKAGLVIINR